MRIDDATFVVTDTETTGTAPQSDRIIEVAAVKLRGGEVVDTFQQLINPERSIPGRIARMTGISTGMVFDAPTADEVLPRYLDFLGEGILTAHNLSFDRNFLNAELQRHGHSEITNDTLCTLRLARRLLPGLKSKGLSRLIQFYDLNVNGRHRALGDAEATATILQQFFSQLDFEHGVDTVPDLLTFQNKSYQTVRRVPNHLKRLREEVLPELPDEPGVYFMKKSNGTVLYIGKAKHLSNRVRSYFNAIESHGARRRKLMNKVRRVEWTTTDTELEALLLESRLIKTHKPSYNRAQRRYRRRPFVRLDVEEHYPRLGWTYHLKNDDAEYYGPLRNREQAELVVEVASRFFQLRECDDAELQLGRRCLYADIDRCTAPCETDDEARYATEVDRVRAFLAGQDDTVLEQIEARMQQASADLDFEQAATFRDWLDQLDGVLARQQIMAAPVRQHHAVLVVPAPDAPRVQCLLIRFGRLVETMTLSGEHPSEDTDALQDRLMRTFTPERTPPSEWSKRDIHELRMLVHWMHRHPDAHHHLHWSAHQPAEAFCERVLQSAISFCENSVQTV